ncbi:MAG: hypothetical protein J4N93_10795 [Chloroflexi bacterium]|nr:hypothetical protein [Chloroflexota bacterium]
MFHLCYDGRGQGTLFAAVNHMVWGPQIQYSHDLGQTWVSPKEPPRLSGDDPPILVNIWHIEPAREAEPQVFYSRDDGDSWELLLEHLPPILSVECGLVG